MRISNQIRDEDRHYIMNLITSGLGELPREDGKISDKVTHVFTVDKGFIVGAKKVMRESLDKKKKV